MLYIYKQEPTCNDRPTSTTAFTTAEEILSTTKTAGTLWFCEHFYLYAQDAIAEW